MKEKIRTGVIGAGFMGELHCKTYAVLDEVSFNGIFDADQARAAVMAEKYCVKAYSDIDELLNNVDAVSIAVPTVLHRQFALKSIEAGKHVLIEKPIAANLKEAEEITAAVKAKGVIAAIGYIERFNPAVIELLAEIKDKKIISIETGRFAPPANRANDVSVVFDLMIHDLDIVLAILPESEASDVLAVGQYHGAPVLTDVEADFMLGNIKVKALSNKVADQKLRYINIRCEDRSYEADLIGKTITVSGICEFPQKTQCLGEEPIKAEIKDFLAAAVNNSKPSTCVEASQRSFILACNIESAALAK